MLGALFRKPSFTKAWNESREEYRLIGDINYRLSKNQRIKRQADHLSLFTSYYFILLAITVKHHPAVRAGDIRGCKVLARIFISHDHVIDIVHRVQSNLIRLAQH